MAGRQALRQKQVISSSLTGEGDGETDHVGIVERVENGTVYTVEGNSGDACRQNSYSIGSSCYLWLWLSLLIKIGQKRKPEVYSSGSFALHSPFTVASMTESSLSSNLLSCASKRLRTELFLTSLLGNMYSSTDTSNIVTS